MGAKRLGFVVLARRGLAVVLRTVLVGAFAPVVFRAVVFRASSHSSKNFWCAAVNVPFVPPGPPNWRIVWACIRSSLVIALGCAP